MTITVRAHTKLMSAVLAAGLVTAAAPVWVPPVQDAVPVVSSQPVLPASFITDLLYSAGTAVSSATQLVATPAEAVISAPFLAAIAAAAVAQNPALIGGALSFLVGQYLDPSQGYLSWFNGALQDLVGLLPNPIGSWAVDALNGTALTVGSVFNGLPDATAALLRMNDIVADNGIGQTLYAAWSLALAPVYLISDVITELAYLPATLEETVESALRDPTEIPGLISNLVYELLDPQYGLLGAVVYNVVSPFFDLPSPIGNAIQNGFVALANGWFELLDAVLPNPVTPTPFATAAADESGSVLATARVSDVPGGDPTVVTVDVPVESVDPVVPSDPGPATTGGVIDEQDDETGNETFSDDQELVDSEDEEQVVVDEIPADEEEITVDDEDNTDLAETDTGADEQSDETEPTADTDTDTDTDTDSPADNSTDNDTAAAA